VADRPDPKTDPDAAEERLDDLGERIEETRERAEELNISEFRQPPDTGFTPKTATNPEDPTDDVGATVKGD
jgi:hypothetical protein